MSAAGPLTVHRPERVAVVIPAKNEAERIEATIASGNRPTTEQVAHVRATYHPTTIAKTLLLAMESHATAG